MFAFSSTIALWCALLALAVVDARPEPKLARERESQCEDGEYDVFELWRNAQKYTWSSRVSSLVTARGDFFFRPN